MRINNIVPVFCEQIPDELEEGKIYISKVHGIAIHLCACGCGVKSVTNLKPVWGSGWQLTESGDMISLQPSIGNFAGENPYHAHYFITNNVIQWC